MRSQTRALLVTVALALLLATAGCTDDGSTGPADAPSADALQENATAVMQEVSTAAFTMSMDIESGGQTITMDADGVMDAENRQMRMVMRMDVGDRSVEVTQYIVDETAYQRIQGQWQTRNLRGQDIWQQGNQIALQRRMLENSTVEIVGSDTLDGRDVWVVSVDPSEDAIQQLVGQTGTGVGENVEVDSLTFEQYVDAETYHVRKIDMTMDATIQGDSASLNMTMTFGDFDEPVDIQVPEEAR